jgi:hypothetical protein
MTQSHTSRDWMTQGIQNRQQGAFEVRAFHNLGFVCTPDSVAFHMRITDIHNPWVGYWFIPV